MATLVRQIHRLSCPNVKLLYPIFSLERKYSSILPASSQLLNINNTFQSFSDVLKDIWDGFLFAAPKKRRSIAKRRHLRKFKQLKPRNDIEDCVVCGHKKLMGRLCKNCFSWTMSLTEKVWEKTGANKWGRYVR